MIVLLPCTKSKLEHPAPASELYTASHYWRCLWHYKDKVAPKAPAFVVSALHGLLDLQSDTLVEPYELSVADLSRDTRKVWAQKVADSVSQMGDTIVWLLPKSYQKHIKPLLPDHQHLTPFDGLRGIGDIKRHCLAAESGDGWGTR